MPCAAVVGDMAVLTVEGGWIRQARGQEVGPQLTCGYLGDTGQGEAGQATKDEGAQLVDHSVAAQGSWQLSCRPLTRISSPRLICGAEVDG